MNDYAPIKRAWTVWEFHAHDGNQVVRVVHPRYPDDHRYAHYFQRIVAQVEAFTRDEALRMAATK